MESGELNLAALSCVYIPHGHSPFSTLHSQLLPVFCSRIETGTLFDILAWFYRAVVVEVRRKVTVTADLCSRIGEQEKAEDRFEALFLFGGAGVGGTAGSVKASLVGDTDRGSVVAFGVRSDVGDVTHMMYRAVFGDVVVITAFGKTLPFVHGVEAFGSEVAGTAGCGAMHHDEGDVSLFDHCFVGD